MAVRRTLALKRKALRDIWAFADLIDFRGGAAAFGNIHHEFAEFIVQPQLAETWSVTGRRRIAMMPRGHLKSTVGAELYALWRIYRNPDIRILMATNIKRLVRGFIRTLRQYFEDSELQQTVWNARPHIKGALVPALDAAGRRKRNSQREYGDDDENEATDKKVIWSSEAIQVLRPGKFKEPTVAAVSTNTVMTGDHYDVVLMDDIVDFRNSATSTARENLQEWALDIESILDPPREVTVSPDFKEWVGDEVVILGTRYFQGDYYEYIITEAEELGYVTFIRNIYKNGKDETDGFIWDKFTPQYVKQLRARLKTRRFASQYLNLVVTDEERLIKPEHIKYTQSWSYKKFPNLVEIKKEGGQSVQVRPVVVVDPAVSLSEKADYTSIVVGGYDNVGNLYVLDMKIGRYTPSQLIDNVYALTKTWQTSVVHIEAVGYQASIIHNMREQFPKRGALALRPFVPKGNKEDRITHMLEPLFSSGMVYLSGWLAQIQELTDELNFFPRSAHDDALDSIAILAEVAKKTTQRHTRPKSRNNRRPAKRTNSKYGGVRV